MDSQFHFKAFEFMMILMCADTEGSVLWNGKGPACETSLECRNCGVHELGLYGMLK